MTINLSVPQTMQELRPRITVVGVGGAGCNAVNNMISADLDGVDFLVANTDGQALAHSLASRKIQLGSAITQGLGAGSKPEIGRAAAEESLEDVMAELADCNMVFHYCWHGRRHWHGRCANHRTGCPRTWHSDRRRDYQTL